ncbi:MAG: glycosyltransferase family 4 protein [Candidatus Nitronauta litoralis]|uniref:Glycosyltransferase family 4 protein n=1 Tax=Candidatus Nitronauta litoralis TaxID=2705533 RepID=A0A7T0FYY3_9BACT|nr:MAG: glycosyltransferase family 4 protein [Candidatus Nitronauta litoralis]
MQKKPVLGAQAIVVSSQLEYQDAIRFGVEPSKLHVIPMGIDLPEIDTTFENVDRPLKLLFVGRIARVRRLEIILKAASRLKREWQLTIVGGEASTSSMTRGGYLDELKTLANNLGVTRNIHWAGSVAPEQLSSFYTESDIFLYTSQYENFGQPLLEAAAHGLPLLSTKVGVAAELIEENKTGFFIDDDPDTLSDQIRQLENSTDRQQMGEALRRKVADQYSWDNVIQHYIELYRKLLPGSGL